MAGCCGKEQSVATHSEISTFNSIMSTLNECQRESFNNNDKSEIIEAIRNLVRDRHGHVHISIPEKMLLTGELDDKFDRAMRATARCEPVISNGMGCLLVLTCISCCVVPIRQCNSDRETNKLAASNSRLAAVKGRVQAREVAERKRVQDELLRAVSQTQTAVLHGSLHHAAVAATMESLKNSEQIGTSLSGGSFDEKKNNPHIQ